MNDEKEYWEIRRLGYWNGKEKTSLFLCATLRDLRETL